MAELLGFGADCHLRLRMEGVGLLEPLEFLLSLPYMETIPAHTGIDSICTWKQGRFNQHLPCPELTSL